MSLRATHHGYTYQDLITGIALVDLLLGTAAVINVDIKGFDDDRFDDLTINYASGRRVRIQIKHTTQDRELSKATFSGDGRSLKLNLLFDSLLSDLREHPDTVYRVVVRDGAPDKDLAEVLRLVQPVDDPGNPLPGIATRRYRFDTLELRRRAPWKQLVAKLNNDELDRACAHLVIDTDAPSSTVDVSSPGPAEIALLRRVTEELGAGRPPNTSRAPEDVALSLVYAATAARTLKGNVTRGDIAPRIGLTTDFGAVAEGHPIESALAVTRVGALTAMRQRVESVAPVGGRLVMTGEPGAGKSWLCQELAESYRTTNWIVARHHCWLGAADTDRDKRVLTEVVVGSLLAQLEQIAPQATASLRPRFAATSDALEFALNACREAYPTQQVLLVVDGLDHVDRVVGRRTNAQMDPSRLLVDQLARINMPPGSCLVIASQPGSHLGNSSPTAEPLLIPRMSWIEVRDLAERYRLVNRDGARDEPSTTTRDEDAVVDLLYDRSGGNALYATYLCRYATRVSPLDDNNAPPVTAKGTAHRLSLVPPTATGLDAYYGYLLEDFTGDQNLAIGALALCDFALTADELAEMLPEVTLILAPALATLAPVLNSQPGLGGLKIHHESFSLHILRDKPETWTRKIRENVATWLAARGFFADARAFRHLPELLAHLEKYTELKELVNPEFVANAILALQPPEALRRVITAVARESELRLDWPALIACVETRKAVDTYESESLSDTLVQYADVVVSILGAEVVSERLLYEGRTTFPSRWGLRLCRSVDRAGAAAPWAAYLAAWKNEKERESVTYSSDRDATLHLAVQLGSLRLAGQTDDIQSEMLDRVAENLDSEHNVDLNELVEVFTVGLPAGAMPDVAAKMTNADNAAQVYMALARLATAGTAGLPEPSELTYEAWKLSPSADIIGYLSHGIPPRDVLSGLGSSDVEEDLAEATAGMLSEPSARNEVVRQWLGLLSLAHEIDPTIPIRFMGQLDGEGFYRAWLRFAAATIGLARDVTEGVTTAQAASTTVRVALEILADKAEPFTGKPRACDLYQVHPLIHDVIENALLVVQPTDLEAVIGHLIAIGDGTTTSLMGMAESGPLATNDLLEILSRVSAHVGVHAIHTLLEVIRLRRNNANTLYSVTADFELATARICIDAGASQEARDCWRRATTLLAAYGGHKDPTIYEFIDSMPDLASVDLAAARDALARLLEPAYLVRQHTDGRGTSHVPNSWWEMAATIDPIAAAVDASNVLLAEVGFEDARAQKAHEKLLETQVTAADPVVLAGLRLAAGSTWRSPVVDVELLKRLRPEVGTNSTIDLMIASFANNVAASYDDQPLMYTGETTKSIATSELVLAVQELGGTAFSIREARKENGRNNVNSVRKNEETDAQKRLEGEQRPVLPKGAAGAVLAARDYASKTYSDNPDAPRWSINALVNAIGWRVLETTLTYGSEDGMQLIDDVAREISLYSDNEVFALVGEGLAARCGDTATPLHPVASYCLVLAYVRIRGGGGWRNFAGRERVDLWKKAHILDPQTAERTLAAAVTAAVDSNTDGVYGVTQSTIAALAAQHPRQPDGTATKCWNAGCSVLLARVPGDAERIHHTYSQTPVPDSDGELNIALATLSIAAIAQPKRSDLRRALLTTALLVSCRPAIAQEALIRILHHELDAGRASWLLEVVQNFLPIGELTVDMSAMLTTLTQTDKLSVRTLAGCILGAHGQPVPNPPATVPAAKLNAALNTLLGASDA